MNEDFAMILDLRAALEPFADLLEDPDDYPDEYFEATVAVADIKRAKQLLEMK